MPKKSILSDIIEFNSGGSKMIDKTTINYRIRDLRNPYRGKKMEQKELAAALGIAQQTLSDYEKPGSNVPSDIIIKLTEIFNVSADYLLGITDCPNSVNTPISQLHLSDRAINTICSGKINPVLLSEILENDAFINLMIDSEAYVDGFVDEGLNNYERIMEFARKKVLEKQASSVTDTASLNHVSISQDEYFERIFAKDLISILYPVKANHAKDSSTSDGLITDNLLEDIYQEALSGEVKGIKGVVRIVKFTFNRMWGDFIEKHSHNQVSDDIPLSDESMIEAFDKSGLFEEKESKKKRNKK